MLLSVIVILLVAAITFFHVVEGLFSATLSAVFAVVAALVAVGYHESLVAFLAPQHFADEANSIALVVLFALTYLILRLISDLLIKGNVRFLPTLDHVGAAVMGLIVGICSTGVVVLALESLPMGPDILGYSRYAILPDRAVVVPTTGVHLDRWLYGQMHDASFTDDDGKDIPPLKLVLPVDDIVLDLTQAMSDGGAAAGARTLQSIHPDYPQELFGQRVTVPVGAKRTYYNYGPEPMVSVLGVWRVDRLEEKDGDLAAVRDQPRPLHTVMLRPGSGQALLVVRCLFGRDAADRDDLVRLTCAAVRLVTVHRDDSGRLQYRDNYPLGAVDDAKLLWTNHIDDPLLIQSNQGDPHGADFAFLVDEQDVMLPAEKGKLSEIAPGTFLEVKRLARIDLADPADPANKAGGDVQIGLRRDPRIAVMRKTLLYKDAGLAVPSHAPAQQPQAAPAVENVATPLIDYKFAVDDKLFTPINVGIGDADANVLTRSIQGALVGRRFQSLDVSPTDTIAFLSHGQFLTDTFWTPSGTKMVQMSARPSGDSWAWADHVSDYALVDAFGGSYHPSGAWARIKQGEGWDKMVAHFRANSSMSSMEKEDGIATDVWLAFIVPSGTRIDKLRYQGKVAEVVNLPVAP